AGEGAEPAGLTGMQFRNANISDIPAIVDLVTRAYRGEASRAGWTTEADLLEGQRIDPVLLRADIARPRSRVLLAADGDALLGCAHVCVDEDEAGGVAGYFGMFAVDPGLQRSGIGHAILGEAERMARE